MKKYLLWGVWDSAKIGNSGDYNYGTVRDNLHQLMNNAGAYAVSQYFKMGKQVIQIRTSGYSKFGDTEIPSEVLSGAKSIDVTGILTLYQGSAQFTLLNLNGVKINN